MKVVLYRPQIPPNTGNIIRTCAALGASLAVVPPCGFALTDRRLKRAGLDYHSFVAIEEISDFDLFVQERRPFFFSSKASRLYTQAPYTSDSILVFGSETQGLPSSYHDQFPEQFYTIPQKTEIVRCLNLSIAVAVVLYEAWRQHSFK